MLLELRPHLAELLPVIRRVAGLDGGAVVRIRAEGSTVSAYATLPFKVLVSRTVAVDAALPALDVAYGAADLLAWLEEDAPLPAARDSDWRGALPPRTGWRRLDRVPDDVVRPLIRSGALALKEAAAREGVPGAEPRAAVSDALLDSVVLTVSDGTGAGAGGAGVGSAGVTLRVLSSLVRMGFVPRGSAVAVDVCGRWTRLSGEYGNAYAEAPGGLTLR